MRNSNLFMLSKKIIDIVKMAPKTKKKQIIIQKTI